MTSEHPKRNRRRRAVALVAAAVMAAVSMTVVAVPAAAAPVSITNATFEWSVNDTMQYEWPFTGAGTCHYLSAGRSEGTAETYFTTAGDVSILRNGTTPTAANRCQLTSGRIEQKVVWSGGTGTVDPTTGAATIQFAGSLSLNWNGGITPLVVNDPVLTVGTDGVGTLVATVDGWAGSQAEPSAPKTYVPPVSGVVVADLGDVSSANPSGFTTTPRYHDVVVDVNGGELPALNHRVGTWGSWPASWVDFVTDTGNGSYFYSSSATVPTPASQLRKAPNPITVDYGLSTSSDSMTIGVTVPEIVEPGEFVWSIDGDGQVTMSQGVNHADHWGYTGAIQSIVVTDNRDGAPSWSISGQVGDFTGGIDGKHLGWKPKVTVAGAGATPGAQVASGFLAGNGLKSSSILASAAAAHGGGSATIGADLDLRLPISTPAGSYSATLTITALS